MKTTRKLKSSITRAKRAMREPLTRLKRKALRPPSPRSR
jgi:hypothetical protein